MKCWQFIHNKKEPENIELRIEGDIIDDGDVWLYEWLEMEHTSKNQFRTELKKHDGKDITLWIDSFGGDVFAAAGMYNALMEHKGNVTVKIDGKAMSAATVIASAGTTVLMSPVAIYMVHNPLTGVMGDMHDLRKTADILDTVKDTIINAYQLKTGKSRNKISELMDNETYMSAKSAIKDGFADATLYENSEGTINNYVSDLSFSRLAIQNSAKASINKLINIQKEEQNKDDTEKKTAQAKLELLLKI